MCECVRVLGHLHTLDQQRTCTVPTGVRVITRLMIYLLEQITMGAFFAQHSTHAHTQPTRTQERLHTNNTEMCSMVRGVCMLYNAIIYVYILYTVYILNAGVQRQAAIRTL